MNLEKNYVATMDELDKIKDNVDPVLSQRIKNYPQYHLLRATAFHHMAVESTDLTDSEREAARTESTKSTLHAVG